VLVGGRPRLRRGGEAEGRAGDPDRMVPAGYPRLIASYSKPLAINTDLAAGDVKKASSALAASICWLVATTPPVSGVMFWRGGGNAPARTTPGSTATSVICAKPKAISPLARAATSSGPEPNIFVLDLSSAVRPSSAMTFAA